MNAHAKQVIRFCTRGLPRVVNLNVYKIFPLFLSLFLTGCLGLTVASTGAQAVYSRHNLESKFNDQYITTQSYRKITAAGCYQNDNISVATFNREVLLTGEITNKNNQQQLTSLIASVPNVKKVHNFTIVSAPSSPLTRVSDSWITTEIKTKLIANDDFDPSLIKVVTENGTVFLMGTVCPEQAKTALAVAQKTQGVQNVVKIFSYIIITNDIA